MRHEIIRSVDGFRALREQWDALLGNSRANQLFLTWEWLDCWFSVHPDVKDLLVICVRDADGELAGVAPMYVRDYTLWVIVPYRVLSMLGDVDCGGEYQTWIARTADEESVCAEIVKALRELRREWDLVWMPYVGAWSGGHDPIVRAMRNGRLHVRTRPRGFSSLLLPDSYEAYLAGMSTNRRQQVRRNTKKILSKPGVEIRPVTRQADLGPALEALFDLHGRRWRSVGEQGVFARNPREQGFYKNFASAALLRGWLAMFALYDHGVPKAVQIGYAYNGALLQLQEGFDPEYSPHVGNALRAWVIQRCIEEGLTEYDFLGGHSEHKRRWLAIERTGLDLICQRSTLRNLPLRFGVWPTGRHLRPIRSKSCPARTYDGAAAEQLPCRPSS